MVQGNESRLSISAFIAVRNEADYLPRTLRHLLADGIEIVVIDNGASAEVSALIEQFRASGAAVSREHLPYQGCFDLRQQLAAKASLIAASRADWVLHLDADEMPHSCRRGESLSGAIARADQAGYNVVNFEEFVFLPIDSIRTQTTSVFFPFAHYYYFRPKERRLMRAWRRDQGFTNVNSGGHRLVGEGMKISPENHVLRHYPFLSQEHAMRKYTQRRYSDGDLALGWHRNRIGFKPCCFAFPSPGELQMLTDIDSHSLDYSRPRRSHYWEWKRGRE